MKKVILVVCVMMLSVFACIPVSAARVDPICCEGNDITDYDPPEGCFWYKIDYTDIPGTYMIRFDKEGQLNPNGPYRFAVTVGEDGEGFTKVLCWKSNIPIYGVIVRGGNSYNIYEYSPAHVTKDEYLISPDIKCGRPADICHVSVIICPCTFPTKTTATTPTTTDSPCIPIGFCFFGIYIALLFVLIIIVIVLFFPKKKRKPCKSNNEVKVNTFNTNADIDKKFDYDKNINNDRNKKDFKKDGENDGENKQ
ncbi:MAG: hypothetical protein PHR14_01565 [Oscillospiraceae bacterium]|nr:hypothetical protein [Oscillospiraceae bacterium]